MCCEKVHCGAIVLILGILLLLKDLEVWDFWGISAWTLVFLIVGLCIICKAKCCKPAKKKK